MKHLVKNGKIIRSGIPSQFTRENGETFWGGYETRTDLHYEDGWREEIIPELNPKHQRLGAAFFDEAEDKICYEVIAIAINLEAEKERHRNDVLEVVGEISRITSAVKNVHDPFRESPELIPEGFKTLLNQRHVLLERASTEIAALTEETCMDYVVCGPEIQGYINQLKSFIL